MRQLFRELKRRNVYKVAVAYAVVGFMVIQAANLIFPALGIPPWAYSLVVVVTLLGFPLALVVAWAFELTPEGVRRSEPEHAGEGAGDAGAPRAVLVGLGGLVLLAVGVVGWQAIDSLDSGDGVSGTGVSPSGESVEPSASMPLSASGRDARSVAVLPFDNQSPNPEDEYFVHGMHDATLTALANLEGLEVTSRTSVARYEETEKSVREIAGELGVAHVLEGSVQRAGERVRITAQLIDARSDRHVWADNFDREYTTDAVFDIQSEVARRVAAALDARLSPTESRRLTRRPTQSLTAYDLYLRGRELLRVQSREDARSAARLFHRALDRDPDFAPAHARLAEAFDQLETLTGRRFWHDSLRTYVRKALEIDPDLPEAHMVLARYHADHGQLREGREEVRRVLELRPNDARAAWLLGRFYRSMGPGGPVAALDQSLCWMRRAVRLEPNVAENYLWLARGHLLLADFVGGERAARQGLSMEPDVRGYWPLVHAALARGDRPAAEAHYRAARSVASSAGPDLAALGQIELALGRIDSARVHLAGLSDRFEGFPMQAAYAEFAYALWRTGERQRARELLERREEVTRPAREEEIAGFWAEFDQAEIHAIRGEREPALDLMAEAVEEGWRHYVRILPEIESPFRELWDDPRFRRLMDRVKADVENMRLRVERQGCEAIRQLPDPRVVSVSAQDDD